MTRGHTIVRNIFKCTPFFAGFLIIFEIILTNQLAGSGGQIQSVDMKIDTLHQQNALLSGQVASASSLTTIAVRASEMGLIEPKKTQYIAVTAELPVAINTSR